MDRFVSIYCGPVNNLLQLFQISQQCCSFIFGHESTIDDEAVRRENRRQVRWRTQASPASEHGVVVGGLVDEGALGGGAGVFVLAPLGAAGVDELAVILGPDDGGGQGVLSW